jgi:hypothetical protein
VPYNTLSLDGRGQGEGEILLYFYPLTLVLSHGGERKKEPINLKS